MAASRPSDRYELAAVSCRGARARRVRGSLIVVDQVHEGCTTAVLDALASQLHPVTAVTIRLREGIAKRHPGHMARGVILNRGCVTGEHCSTGGYLVLT